MQTPTGMQHTFPFAAEPAGVIRHRPPPITPRPYQHEAVDAAYDQLRASPSTLIVMPTGAGKTVVFGLIARDWPRDIDCQRRILILAHRHELIFQAADKVGRITGEPVDIEMADLSSNRARPARIVVSSIQTQAKRHTRFSPDDFGLVVVDEAHHAPADSYRAVLAHYRQNPKLKVLGVTATPDRHDELALGQIFETVAYDYQLPDAIDHGWLVPISQQFITVDGLDFSSCRTTAGDLNAGDLDAIVREERMIHGFVSPTVQAAGDLPTLVFGASVEHAHKMAEVFNRHKPGSAVALDGTTNSDLRREQIARFGRGEYQFLCNCLDEQTEILTQNGWCKREQVKEGDIVASMVTSTGRMEWVPALAKIERPRGSAERMVSLETPRVSFRVTEGHRMVYRVSGALGWKIDTAHQLAMRNQRFQLPMACFGIPDLVDLPSAKSAAELTLAECRFIGLFVSDGCLAGGSRGITISQSRRNQWVIDDIVSTLNECGFDWKQSAKVVAGSHHEQVSFRIPRGNIGGTLARNGWDSLAPYLEKHGTDLWWGFNREQWLAFIEGLWLGDGIKSRKWLICNTDRELLSLVQAISACRGLAASLSAAKDNGPLATKPIYHLSIRDRSHITSNLTITTTIEESQQLETVWCISNRNGTIITRRNGKSLVMGQCSLFLEGFDEPRIAVVAVARPTKSRALYSQIIGRGTRPLPGCIDSLDTLAAPEHRRKLIAESAKPRLLVLDFVGNSGRHKLVSTADILGGEIADDVVDRARQIAAEESAKGRPKDMREALAQAEEEELTRQRLAKEQARKAHLARQRQGVIGNATYTAREINPFDLFEIRPRREPDWHRGRTPTGAQRQCLIKCGMAEKDVQCLTFWQASQIIDELTHRREAGLCTFKQARLLAKHGYDGTNMSFAEASNIINQLAANGWRRPDA